MPTITIVTGLFMFSQSNEQFGQTFSSNTEKEHNWYLCKKYGDDENLTIKNAVLVSLKSTSSHIIEISKDDCRSEAFKEKDIDILYYFNVTLKATTQKDANADVQKDSTDKMSPDKETSTQDVNCPT